MDNQTTGSPPGDTLALLIQPAALLAGATFAAAQLSRNYAMAIMIERARQSGHFGMVGFAGMLAGMVVFAVFAIVHFMLSRRLGGPEDSGGEPDFGNWAALMFLYFLVSQLVTFITPLMLSISGTAVTSYPFVMGAISFVMRLIFFPIMVTLAAMAHDGKGLSFGDIWSFLTARGIAWSGGYVLLSLAVTLIPMALMAALGPHPGGMASGTMLVPPLVIAAGQLLTIVYVIAAYRAARASKGGNAPHIF